MVFLSIGWDGEAEEEAIFRGGFMGVFCVLCRVFLFVLEQISQKAVDMDELQLAVPQAKNLTR